MKVKITSSQYQKEIPLLLCAHNTDYIAFTLLDISCAAEYLRKAGFFNIPDGYEHLSIICCQSWAIALAQVMFSIEPRDFIYCCPIDYIYLKEALADEFDMLFLRGYVPIFKTNIFLDYDKHLHNRSIMPVGSQSANDQCGTERKTT